MFAPAYDIYYDMCVYATHGREVQWRREEHGGRRKEGKAGGEERRSDNRDGQNQCFSTLDC